jgi:hypothetical protein
MSEKKYQLMIDPTPQGWVYGFPRALPDEAVMGKGSDLWIKTDFDLTEWVCSFGYPEDSFQYYSVFPQEIKDEAAEKMGDTKFTTAGDFIDEQNKFTQQQWDRVVGYGKVPDEYRKGDDDKYVYPGSDPQE